MEVIIFLQNSSWLLAENRLDSAVRVKTEASVLRSSSHNLPFILDSYHFIPGFGTAVSSPSGL